MSVIFHSAVVALNSYAIWYDQNYVDLPFPVEEFAKMPWKARGIFLTFWCLVLQTVYFTIALINDIVGTNATAPKKPPLIRKIKDILFSLAFTIAIYVASAFWGLYLVNKDFIFPEDIELQFPSWVNHTMHTFIVPFILIELFISKRNYPSRTLGVSVALLFNLAYVCWLHGIYFYTGIWVYPFLNVFTWSMKVFFFACSSIIGISVYVLGEKLNSLSSLDIRVTYTNGSSKKH
ncbi:androgen-induced gene 1 protein-like [Anticarsia gemmatalis]|uniref:androgen-induced gene 1 protein-like n=1 Tax=Anticarsia gemmatalis TaxID=129554 RepID=UPI003F77129A